jgi:peptidoglycan/LPS O-acetylase OafA/YrhL
MSAASPNLTRQENVTPGRELSDAQVALNSAAPTLPRRLDSIDFLRGAAALAVVLCHVVSSHSGVWHQLARAQHPWLNWLSVGAGYGREGVALFFVISGFCIHLRWARQNVGPNSSGSRVPFWDFWKRRLHRLYPPYFVALCFSMAVAWLQLRTSGRAELSFDTSGGLLRDFLVHVPMLHGLHPDYDYRGGNNVFWTLAREEYFYLAYFPLLWLRQRWGIVWSVGLVGLISAVVPLLASAAWGRSGPGTWEGIAHYALNSKNSAAALWIQWCLGMIAVEAFCSGRQLPAWSRAWFLVPVWATAAVLADLARLWPFVPAVSWGMAFWTLINACAEAEGRGRWPLHSRLVRWLSFVGGFSYSLYLVHRPLLIVWRKAELTLLSKLGLPSLEAQPLFILAQWAAGVTVCYWAGRLFFALVEKWFLPRPERARPL